MERLAELWIINTRLDELKMELEQEQKKLKALISSMTTEELIQIMDAFYLNNDIESVIPDCVVHTIHELEEREDSERA